MWLLGAFGLTSMFAIDVCAYAVLSNHYHLLLHVDCGRAQGWSQREVIVQWQKLFVAPALVERVEWTEQRCRERGCRSNHRAVA